MARIQSKPAHDSEARHTKDFQGVNATKAAAGSDHRLPQKEVIHLDSTAGHRSIEEPSSGFEIMGFPWQFALVTGVIAGGVLVIVLKVIGLF